MWTSYTSPPNPANAKDVNNIYYNQLEIIEKLVELRIIETAPDTFKTISANYSMLYQDIASVYINIEGNFDVLNDNECQSAYYIASVKRGDFEPNRKEWQRWIDILNDMYDIVNGIKGKWQYLRCTDGYPTINGNKILVQGEIVNGT